MSSLNRWMAVVVSLAAMVAVVALLIPEEEPGRTVVVVDGPDRNAAPDLEVELGAGAQDVEAAAEASPERFDLAGDLRGADGTPEAEHEGPLATPNWPGCTTRILPRNWSNRTAGVRAIGLHYTAGANRRGRSDMDGLTAYASRPSAGVSWHFLIDSEGHCYYSVPVQKKAWTIGNLNSQTVNIEVIGTGREGRYPAESAGQRKLSEVVRRIGRVYGIPMRLGATDGRCNVTRTGIITHWQGGPCSGGHSDIRPFDIAAEVRQIAGVNRKLVKWERSHRIAHAKLRTSRCRGDSACGRKYRSRNRKLHRLIARERG